MSGNRSRGASLSATGSCPGSRSRLQDSSSRLGRRWGGFFHGGVLADCGGPGFDFGGVVEEAEVGEAVFNVTGDAGQGDLGNSGGLGFEELDLVFEVGQALQDFFALAADPFGILFGKFALGFHSDQNGGVADAVGDGFILNLLPTLVGGFGNDVRPARVGVQVLTDDGRITEREVGVHDEGWHFVERVELP